MRRLLAALLAIILLGEMVAASTPRAEAAGCQFTLGFKALHDLIPALVGACRADEHHNPVNGDGLQETVAWHGKGGLLVWRKADNWTAFTDGATTWVNGPLGLQKRRNDERFAWEREPAPVAAQTCALTDKDAEYSGSVPQPDGSIGAFWTIRNRCDRPVNLTLDGRLLTARGGQPLADAATSFVVDLAPGDSTRVGLRFLAPNGEAYSWRVASADANHLCGGPSGPWHSCVEIDPWLAGSLADVMSSPSGEWLVKVAAENGVRIRRGDMPVGALGSYEHGVRTVTIDRRLDSYSSWARAVVLTHELQHAVDDAAGHWPTTPEACYRAEEAAFSRQAAFWRQIWNGNLPPDYTAIHAEFNDVARTVARDPIGFAQALTQRYAAECGGQ